MTSISKRLIELKSYSILDTLPESDFDNLTAIAAEICQTPIALISLLDDKRQWFKSHHGLAVGETPIEQAFCVYAIDHKDSPFVVTDATKDCRFKNNPLVTGYPNIVFYAGIPITSYNGNPLGTLCVIDTKPKKLTDRQINSLSALANQVMNLFELRRNEAVLKLNLEMIKTFREDADQKILVSLTNIKSLSRILERADNDLDDQTLEILDLLKRSSNELKTMIKQVKLY